MTMRNVATSPHRSVARFSAAPKGRGVISRSSLAQGFTLIELMVVIVLVGTLLAVLGSKIIGNKQRGEWKIAQTQLSTLSQKVESYQSDTGSLPDSLDQLVTAPSNAPGWLGPYAQAKEFKDPWQHPIEYRHPGDNNAPYELISLGVDGKPGGEGVDKDIVAP
jgi:general secretion pathway protein G